MRGRVTLLSSCAFFSAITAFPATAQDNHAPQAEASVGLGEIVVTARRREERLQDVPISISAIGGEDLARRGVLRTEDLMGSIPNLQIGSFVGGATTPNITLRGIGVGNEFNATAASPIGVYIDEDYQGFRPAHGQQMFDLERLEVVKGPQGTLYGRNTTGGAINFISRIPELGAPTGYATARYGNYNTWAVEGGVEATLIPDVLGIRIAGNATEGDGYIKNRSPAGVNLTDKDFGSTDSKAVRVTIRLKPNDDLDFVLKGYWAKSNPIGVTPIMRALNPDGTLNPGGPDVSGYARGDLDNDEAQPNTLGHFLNKTKGLTFRASWNTGPATITSVSGWNKSFYHADTDCDGGINSICGNVFQSEAEQFNQDLRINFDFDQLNFIVGGYYGWQNINTNNEENYFGFLDDFLGADRPFNPPIATQESIDAGMFDPFSDGTMWTGIYAKQHFIQVSRSKAIYGEATYKFDDALSLTVGGRYTWDKIAYKDALTRLVDANGVVQASTIPFSYPFDPDITPFSTARSSKSFTGRAILDYRFAPDAHIFASFGKGYRSGTYNGFAYTTVDQIYFVPPEKVNAYEVGIKSELMGGRLRLNASAFYYDYKNQQLQEIVGSVGLLRSLNGRVWGVELEATAQITSDLRVAASFGALDTKYTANLPEPSIPTKGNEWPFAPAVTFNINANWAFLHTGNGRFRIIPEAQYSDKYYYEVFNNPALVQPDYWIVNGKLTYESDDGYSISAWGKNLFNKFYVPWGANTGDFGAHYYIRGMPRTYGVEASFRF